MGYFDKLINIAKPIIYFQLEDMKELQLDDSIYVRMNARGKLLTDFEHFKALFEKHLSLHDLNECNYFSVHIDTTLLSFSGITERINLLMNLS